MFQVRSGGLPYRRLDEQVGPHSFQVCLDLFLANGETAFRPGGLNNLAVFKSRHGLCRSVMMNKRSAISGTVKAIIDVPWSALNPETNEGQSLRILFDNDYTVIFKVRMSLLIIISLLISLLISCILRSLIGPWSLGLRCRFSIASQRYVMDFQIA